MGVAGASLLLIVGATVLANRRLEDSHIGRAWEAIREDEIAAKAMGINTRNLKLLAFGMGATFGGVSGVMFASFQGFISPESFSLPESVMIVAMVVLGVRSPVGGEQRVGHEVPEAGLVHRRPADQPVGVALEDEARGRGVRVTEARQLLPSR